MKVAPTGRVCLSLETPCETVFFVCLEQSGVDEGERLDAD
jgi:hypothetical protein